MRPVALITDAGRGSAIACIRSLGSKGFHVIAGDCDRRSAGFRSRFASECMVYPAPERSPSAFVRCLLDRVEASAVDLIVPVTDACIHPLASARERFAGKAALAIAPDAALATVTDKRATLALARRLGVPVPESRFVRTLAEARGAARELGFPIVVKPTVSRRYLQREDRIERGTVSFAADREELERRLSAPGVLGHVLLQRYQQGVGIGVEALAREGQLLHAFQHRRLAEIPITGGASAWRESMPLDAELLEYARRLIGGLAWTGLIMVEFKVGACAWLMEVNGRIWGSLPLACRAGVDFPGALAEMYVRSGNEVRPPGVPYEVGLRTYDLELMLSWVSQVLAGRGGAAGLARPTRRQALAGLAGLIDPAQHSDLSGGRDFGPRLAEVGRVVRKLARKMTSGRVG